MKILYTKTNKGRRKETFIILAHPRSGSTWLSNTLKLHPHIECLYEPFNGQRWGEKFHRILRQKGPSAVFNKIRSLSTRDNIRHYGCKHLINQSNNNHDNVLLASYSDVIILLTRINTSAAVSFFRSLKVDSWHFYNWNNVIVNETWPTVLEKRMANEQINDGIITRDKNNLHQLQNAKMIIKISKIRNFLLKTRHDFAFLKRFLKQKDKCVIDLTYDKLFSNTKKYIKKICHELGEKPHNAYSSEIKTMIDYNWLVNKDEINEALGEEFGYL